MTTNAENALTDLLDETVAQIDAIDGAQRIYNAHCEDLYDRADQRPRRFSEIETDLEGEYSEGAGEVILTLGTGAIGEAGSVADAWLADVLIRSIAVQPLKRGDDTTETRWLYDRSELFVLRSFDTITVTSRGDFGFELVSLDGRYSFVESEELTYALDRRGQALNE